MTNELLWGVTLVCNFGGISLAYRLWGKTGLYCWVAMAAILANMQVMKTVSLFGMVATLGNIIYGTSFLATDILSENHGKAAARQAVAIGFFSLIFTTAAMNLALLYIPHESDFAQGPMQALFSVMPRIALASLAAYGISQYHDVWAYDFWRKRFPHVRHIWIRNNFSTLVSQLLDTAVFVSIAFAGIYPWPVLAQIFCSTYVLKLLVALADTPFVYLARRWKDRGVAGGPAETLQQG
ncbi:queuosine precursor transporter [Aminiphilus sp.]|jgi:uncharacterized integral membrane protein (TIGR00697 family)|uniref:queuosine precursor transporter n=1 Tax=Aminiphilus sp. TaxID=1872488 RepID=UPI002627C235|nr:queuosine precursor transporter [Aminiphilus sp.]